MQYRSAAARGTKATRGRTRRAFAEATFPVSDVATTARPKPRLSASTCCALVFAVISAKFSSSANERWMGARTTLAVVMPTLLPTFATVASSKKRFGKNGVSISTRLAQSYTTELVNRNRFTSESNSRPKLVATDNFPRRPNPSFNTQFTAAAAGRRRVAPRPIACSICCVANTVMQLEAARW